MTECPISDYLDSAKGKYSEAYADDATKRDLSGKQLERVNDLSESTFGTVDDYYHSFRNQHVSTAAGVSQSRMNHDYDIAYNNAGARKSKGKDKAKSQAPTADGAFTKAMQSSVGDVLPEVARKKLASDITAERKRREAQHVYYREVEAAKKQKKLNSLRHSFKLACLAFEIVRLTTHAELATALRGISDAAKLKLLKDQVRHYVYGLGLTKEPFGPKVRFSDSKDANIGTIAELTARVKKMITAATSVALPDEPPLPALTIRVPGKLGSQIKQREKLDADALAEAESYKAAWAAEIKAGNFGDGGGGAHRAQRQPPVAPTPAELVNKRIEVLFDCVIGSGRSKKKGNALVRRACARGVDRRDVNSCGWAHKENRDWVGARAVRHARRRRGGGGLEAREAERVRRSPAEGRLLVPGTDEQSESGRRRPF